MGLANDPEVLFLDEPFSALDTHIRTHLHKELLEIWRKLGQTVFRVTHTLKGRSRCPIAPLRAGSGQCHQGGIAESDPGEDS